MTTITAALFAVAGVFKLAGADAMVEAFAGGLGLMGIVGGAFITHMASGDPFGMAVGSIVFFVLALATTWLRGRDFARTATQVFG